MSVNIKDYYSIVFIQPRTKHVSATKVVGKMVTIVLTPASIKKEMYWIHKEETA